MSIASLLSIKVTSPITHMVSSAVRGVAASLLGKWLFHDIIKRCACCSSFVSFRLTPSFIRSGRACSIGIILAGSLWYTWIKHQESQPAYEPVPLDDIEEGKASKTRASRDARD